MYICVCACIYFYICIYVYCIYMLIYTDLCRSQQSEQPTGNGFLPDSNTSTSLIQFPIDVDSEYLMGCPCSRRADMA